MHGNKVTTQVKTISRERLHRTQRAFKAETQELALFFEFSALLSANLSSYEIRCYRKDRVKSTTPSPSLPRRGVV
jgi:hypothetical protein